MPSLLCKAPCNALSAGEPATCAHVLHGAPSPGERSVHSHCAHTAFTWDGMAFTLHMRLQESPLCLPSCPEYQTKAPYADQTSAPHCEGCEHAVIMDAQKAAGTYRRQIDLQGILPKHNTYGRGTFHQVHIHNLRENPLCAPSCPKYKKAGAPINADFWSCAPDVTHEPMCEHAIIMEAQKAAGTWRPR